MIIIINTVTLPERKINLHVLSDPGKVLVDSRVNSWEVRTGTVNSEASDADHSVASTDSLGEESSARIAVTRVSSSIPGTNLRASDGHSRNGRIRVDARLLCNHGYSGLSQPVLRPTTSRCGSPSDDSWWVVGQQRSQVFSNIGVRQTGSANVPSVRDGAGKLDDGNIVRQGVGIPSWMLDAPSDGDVHRNCSVVVRRDVVVAQSHLVGSLLDRVEAMCGRQDRVLVQQSSTAHHLKSASEARST